MMNRFENLWRHGIGQLTLILLLAFALYAWPIPAAIFVVVLLAGMFHQHVLDVFTELVGHVNEFFLGTPIDGDTNRREGGLLAGLRGIAAALWNWVRKPFQPRQQNGTPDDGRESAVSEDSPAPADGRLQGVMSQLGAFIRGRQAKMRQKASEDASKPELRWTHLIGGVILTALFAIFVAADLVIVGLTLFGMLGGETPKILTENPILKSFELMTVACLIGSALLYGVIIGDLMGFIPVLPLHLFSVRAQKILLLFSTLCFAGTLAVVIALGLYRAGVLGSGDAATPIESSTGLDITSRFDPITASEPASTAFAPDVGTATYTARELTLMKIALVGIPTLAAIGAFMSFNGPIVLAIFLGLGLVAAIAGVTALSAVLGRGLHFLLAMLLGVGYMVLRALLAMATMIATPIVYLFHVRGTDINDDHPDDDLNNRNPPQPPVQPPPPPQNPPPAGDGPQSSAPERGEGDNQAPFTPSDADWNPLA